MKGKKKDITFIIIFFLSVTMMLAYLFQSSYAKYRKNIEAESSLRIASWDIKLNNESLAGKTKLTNNLTPTYIENEYVNSGVIAPGCEGYVDINIDAAKVDVTFTYSVIVALADDNVVEDLEITHYQINPSYSTSEKKQLNQNSKKVTGTILHNTALTTIRLFVSWDDSETNIMDNKKDTAIAIDPKAEAIIKATINFTQKSS